MFHPQGPTFWELGEQCLSSTERGYDLLAPKFDYTPFRTPDIVLQPAAKRLGEIEPFDAALDICCGTGAAMQMLRPLCRQRVVGIDFSQGMLDVAIEKTTSAAGDAEMEFVRGDVLDMPFSQAFDLAVCFGALGHILRKDEPQFVDRIRRALKPGGRFVFATSYMPSLISPGYWLCRGFNAAMRVRNLLVRPPFIMYYLTFLLPGCKTLLEAHGFDVDVCNDVYTGRLAKLKLVVATKRS